MMIKAKSKLPFFDKLVLFFNYLFAAGLLISYLAPFINPQTFWPIAFFGLAYPLLLTVNLLFLVYWFFRSKIYMLVSIACIVVGYNVFLNNFGFHKPTADTSKQSGNQIRLMEYNVHSFVSFAFGASVSTRHDIFGIIADQKPDILCFEEFYSRKSGKLDICDSITRIFQSDQYYFEGFSKSSIDAAGLAIFSKYPILNRGIVRFSNTKSINQCIYVDVKANDRVFRAYCVHLQSISLEHEDYKYLDSMAQNGKTDLHSSKRIVSKLKAAFIKRGQQVLLVKQDAAKCPYPYVIMGDFNDTPASYAVNQMAKGLKNAFVEKGFGMGRTYNGDFPNFQIDYIMASPQFDVLNYKIIEKKLSDHYPVRSDLMLR
jgi:endonuclease/exonuclease/phosphatase family metal-dependent hydrolase